MACGQIADCDRHRRYGTPGIVTVAAGISDFYDDVTIANTVEGAGLSSVKICFEPNAAIPVTYFTGGGSGTITATNPGDTLSITGSKFTVNGSS